MVRWLTKKILFIILTPVLLLLIVVIVAYLGLNSLVRRAIQSGLTTSLKTPTTISYALVSPFGGSISLTDLDVASPQGFASPQMLTFGGLSASAHVGQLFGSPVHLTSITIDKPHLIIEQAGGKLNVLVLKDNTASPTASGSTTSKPMLLTIDELDLNNSAVTIIPGLPGVQKQYDVTLPSVTLNDIGKGSGEDIGQVVVDVATALASKAADSDQVPAQVRELLHLNVGDLTQQITDDAQKALQTGNVGDLGKLFGGGKKKKKNDQ